MRDVQNAKNLNSSTRISAIWVDYIKDQYFERTPAFLSFDSNLWRLFVYVYFVIFVFYFIVLLVFSANLRWMQLKIKEKSQKDWKN